MKSSARRKNVSRLRGKKSINRAPAFQFFPDKHLAHTRRLGDLAYRVYWDLISTLWLQAVDYCSVEAKPEAVAALIGTADIERVRTALSEIQNPFAPLLKEEQGRYVSNGLRKEAEKQRSRRLTNSTNARKGCAQRRYAAKNKTGETPAIAEISLPSPTPSSSSAPQEHREREPVADDDLRGMIDSIRSCRKEYSRLSEPDVASVLAACPRNRRPALAEAVRNWCADQANAMKSFDLPTASLRKLVDRVADPKAAERTTTKPMDREKQYERVASIARG